MHLRQVEIYALRVCAGLSVALTLTPRAHAGDYGVHTPAPGLISLLADGNSVLTANASGWIGIGTMTPAALLDLGAPGVTPGVVRLEGASSGYVQIAASAAAGAWTLTLPASPGTLGQVLTTNGTGALVWTSPASVTASLIPTGSATHSLGSAALPFAQVNAVTGSFTGGITAPTITATTSLSGPLSITTLNSLGGSLVPNASGTYNLGSAAFKWANVYATNGLIQTSDARAKRDVHDSDLGLGFIARLRPVSYRWTEGPDQDRHFGLIAQETEAAVDASVARPGERVIVSRDESTGLYGLKYAELISPLIRAVQEVYAEHVELRAEVARLEAERATLRETVRRLEVENEARARDLDQIKRRLGI